MDSDSRWRRSWRMMLPQLLRELRHDIRYGARGLRRRPGFTLMTASSLALGIGATTVVLALIDSYLLRPLPVRNPDELVVVGASNRASGSFVGGVMSLPSMRDIAARTDLFQDVSGTTLVTVATRTSEADPGDRAMYLAVTERYFPLLGVQPVLGRLLTPDDHTRRERVVVLSHRTWRTRFGADPAVIGRTVRLNTVEFVVIGVAPPEFKGTDHIVEVAGFLPTSVFGVLYPGQAGFEERRDAGRFTVIARRHPHRSIAEIAAALAVLSRQIEDAYPEVGEQYRLVPLAETRARPNLPSAGRMIPVVTVFATLALRVLLTASVNATNLILARGSTRATELAVRQALGASRARLVSQLLTETLLLSLAALAGGWVLARVAITALTSVPLAADGIPLSWGLELDVRVFGMAAAVALGTGLIAGIGPALAASRIALQQRLRDGGRGASRRGRRGRSALVVVQVAASLVVLVAAGLFLASARQAQHVDLGFRADHVLTVGLDASLARLDEAAARTSFQRIEQAVAAVPGVRSTAWANTVPIKKGAVALGEVRGDGAADVTLGLFIAAVGPGYFDVLEIPVLEGRGFEPADDTTRGGVVVLNRRAAEMLWPGRSAIGRTVRLERDGPALEVIGVVRDSRYLLIGEAPRPYLYRPLTQSYSTAVHLHVRTTVDPARLLEPVRAAVTAIDGDLVPFEVRTLEDDIDTSPNGTLLLRLGARFTAAIGLLAVGLTLVGLYGVIAYSVAQRTREIGLRMALGATRANVVRSILADGGKLALGGIVVGVILAVLVSRMAAGLLLGSRAADPLIFAVVVVGLGSATLLSAWLPARRASRIDPVKALHAE